MPSLAVRTVDECAHYWVQIRTAVPTTWRLLPDNQHCSNNVAIANHMHRTQKCRGQTNGNKPVPTKPTTVGKQIPETPSKHSANDIKLTIVSHKINAFFSHNQKNTTRDIVRISYGWMATETVTNVITSDEQTQKRTKHLLTKRLTATKNHPSYGTILRDIPANIQSYSWCHDALHFMYNKQAATFGQNSNAAQQHNWSIVTNISSVEMT